LTLEAWQRRQQRTLQNRQRQLLDATDWFCLYPSSSGLRRVVNVAIATQKHGNFHGLYLLSAAVHQKAQKLAGVRFINTMFLHDDVHRRRLLARKRKVLPHDVRVAAKNSKQTRSDQCLARGLQFLTLLRHGACFAGVAQSFVPDSFTGFLAWSKHLSDWQLQQRTRKLRVVEVPLDTSIVRGEECIIGSIFGHTLVRARASITVVLVMQKDNIVVLQLDRLLFTATHGHHK